MATISAGINFPTELVTEMFDAVKGHSALAKLSDRKPMPFSGVTEFVFTADGEASLVAEGAAKPAGNAAANPVIIKPVKFVYQNRVSDEFLKAGDEKRMRYLETFAEGFSRKIARALDISAMHGVNPATGTAVDALAANNFDAVTNSVTYAAATVDDNIGAAIAMIEDGDVNGIALSPVASGALAAIKANNVSQYPEFKFGQNPDSFYGMRSDVNSTVSFGEAATRVIVGDFANAFRWGYVEDIPLDVIRYGDPDGAGRDLKQYNEVCLRAEAYIGWGILDMDSFAIVKTA